eukprot:COSAG01_NODE_41598_length_449_cov_1.520000_2_plen_65_part_01
MPCSQLALLGGICGDSGWEPAQRLLLGSVVFGILGRCLTKLGGRGTGGLSDGSGSMQMSLGRRVT